MNNNTYKYNAGDDGLREFNKSFTSRKGDGTDDPEEDLLSCLKLTACCKSGMDFLDIGSGLGRIVDIILPYAGQVVALEPDAERYQSCRSSFRNRGNVEVQNIFASDYKRANPGKRFDLITVAMVLQHISTQQSSLILNDVFELLTPRGVAIIATTHLSTEVLLYAGRSVPVSAEEFDRYAENPATQDWGIPVRMFSRESFEEALLRASLEIIVWCQFAYVRPECIEPISGLYGVRPDEIRDVGTSQFAVVRARP